MKLGYVGRLWYYFRLGYSTYLVFLLGYVSTLITVYYLAVKNIPPLLDAFPHFAPFAVLATIIGIPLSVAIGWVHIKRSAGFSSEVDISVEANPYYYRLAPGWQKEVWFPVYLEMLVLLEKLMVAHEMLSTEERAQIQSLQGKIRTLIAGGIVGTPRRKL